SDPTGFERGFERRAQVDHLPVRRAQSRLHEQMALLLRRRIEQDVRDAVRRQVQIEVLRVPVRRADLAVVELVAALWVCLDQADDVVLWSGSEAAIPGPNRRKQSP